MDVSSVLSRIGAFAAPFLTTLIPFRHAALLVMSSEAHRISLLPPTARHQYWPALLRRITKYIDYHTSLPDPIQVRYETRTWWSTLIESDRSDSPRRPAVSLR